MKRLAANGTEWSEIRYAPPLNATAKVGDAGRLLQHVSGQPADSFDRHYYQLAKEYVSDTAAAVPPESAL